MTTFAPVNKLVYLAWHLCAMSSFQRFTLHLQRLGQQSAKVDTDY